MEDVFDGVRRGSPARSTRVLRFWAGSGTESRKPSTCIVKERNAQLDPCLLRPVLAAVEAVVDEGGGMAFRALLSDSERSFSALTLPAGRAVGCGSIDICWKLISTDNIIMVHLFDITFSMLTSTLLSSCHDMCQSRCLSR